MVLIHNVNVPPLNGPIGRIVEVHKSSDNSERRDPVKTPHNLYERTLPHIAQMPIYADEVHFEKDSTIVEKVGKV